MTVVNDSVSEIISNFSLRHSDQTFLMCYEMQPDRVIDEIISPEFKAFKKLGAFNNKRIDSGNLIEKKFYFRSLVFGQSEKAQTRRYLSSGMILKEDFIGRIFALCRIVDLDFHGIFMRESFQKTSALLNSHEFLQLSAAEYAVDVKVDDHGKAIISLRALGVARLNSATLSQYRKKLREVAIDDFTLAEAHLLKFMHGLGEKLDKMLQGRAAREKSIETLLGI